jgi:hypothetical protein
MITIPYLRYTYILTSLALIFFFFFFMLLRQWDMALFLADFLIDMLPCLVLLTPE